MANNRKDLNELTEKLIRRVGVKEVIAILSQFDGATEGYPKRQLKQFVSRLCVAHEADIDGG